MPDWKYMPVADWMWFLFVSVVAFEVEQKHCFTNPVDHQYSKLALKKSRRIVSKENVQNRFRTLALQR